jgi:hypothetical protein
MSPLATVPSNFRHRQTGSYGGKLRDHILLLFLTNDALDELHKKIQARLSHVPIPGSIEK